jgi:hypothetical protein
LPWGRSSKASGCGLGVVIGRGLFDYHLFVLIFITIYKYFSFKIIEQVPAGGLESFLCQKAFCNSHQVFFTAMPFLFNLKQPEKAGWFFTHSVCRKTFMCLTEPSMAKPFLFLILLDHLIPISKMPTYFLFYGEAVSLYDLKQLEKAGQFFTHSFYWKTFMSFTEPSMAKPFLFFYDISVSFDSKPQNAKFFSFLRRSRFLFLLCENRETFLYPSPTLAYNG